MILFSGSNSENLAKEISSEQGIDLGKIEIKKFPDGEIHVKILSSVEGEDCYVLQSTPNNDALIELFLILDALRDLGARSVNAIIPYLGYARQDRIMEEGEGLSSKTILTIINSLSDSITTVNAHFFKSEGKEEFQGIKINNLDAFPLIGKYFVGKINNPVVIAPDHGALDYAKEAASILGCESDYLEKKRISGEEVEMKPKSLGVEGKDVLLLDDIISTGGTMLKAANSIRSQGARSVHLACVHAVFAKGTSTLSEVSDELLCTNSIETSFSKISLAELIAKELG